jgi:hypothetical protein
MVLVIFLCLLCNLQYIQVLEEGPAKRNDDRCIALACINIPRPYENTVFVPEMQRVFVYRKCRRSRPGIWLLQLFDIFQP